MVNDSSGNATEESLWNSTITYDNETSILTIQDFHNLDPLLFTNASIILKSSNFLNSESAEVISLSIIEVPNHPPYFEAELEQFVVPYVFYSDDPDPREREPEDDEVVTIIPPSKQR